MKTATIVASLLFAPLAWAHHSYVMFDGTKTQSVSGTIAKLEWVNPHVFVWVYVPNATVKGGYDLYAFENASPNVLLRLGWSRTVLAAGQKAAVEYWPLKDGRNGGHFLKATLSDGQVLYGAGGPNAAKGEGAETYRSKQRSESPSR